MATMWAPTLTNTTTLGFIDGTGTLYAPTLARAGGEAIVEIAFGNDPLDSSYTWTDVTEYVRAVAIRRGRSRRRDSFTTGLATVVLDNSDRRFEPDYAGSPYSGQILPLVPLRISGTYAGTTYVLFLGYVEQWPQEWPGGGKDATTTVVAVDGQKILNLARLTTTVSAAASGTMAADVLDEIGWPSGLRDLEEGRSTLQAASPDDQSALELLRTIALSENGAFFMSHDGKATFWGRDHWTTAVSAGTFSDSGGTATLPYLDLALNFDDSQLWNRVTVTRTGGTAQTASDTGSITAYGERNLDVAADLIATDAEASDAASWLVEKWKAPAVRVEQIRFRVPPKTDDVRWEQAFGREIGEVVTIERTPPAGGTAITQDLHIEGVQHRMVDAGSSWEVVWDLSSVYDVGAEWILNTSKLNTTTRLAY